MNDKHYFDEVDQEYIDERDEQEEDLEPEELCDCPLCFCGVITTGQGGGMCDDCRRGIHQG